jgi:hypothetical protein
VGSGEWATTIPDGPPLAAQVLEVPSASRGTTLDDMRIMRSLKTLVVVPCLLALGLVAGGCAAEDEDAASDDADVTAGESELSFRQELPTGDIFAKPFTKAFPIEIERRGIKVKTTITPTVKLSIDNPVIEGKVTVGKSRLTKLPKIMDAELKMSAGYAADLSVDLDIQWNNTENKEIMREIASDFEAKLNGGKALALATNLGETNIPVKDANGKTQSKLPLKGHYEVVVTCSFQEIDGDLQGVYSAGVKGTATARAIYNSEGVEKRRFKKDPKKKFELDLSDAKIDPEPSFRFTGFRQHVKGSCAVQPVVVVNFENNVGVRLRVDARSTFDTQVKAQEGEGGEQFTLRSTPALSLWGESDVRVPIVHTTIDKDTQLFSRVFPEIVVDVGN